MKPSFRFAGWGRHLGRLRGNLILKNALALYVIQGASFVLPLITLPYLARVLRPEGWGLVVFAQAFSVWLGLLLQYGFAYSGTRDVARHRGAADRIARVVAGVQGAKVLLLVAAVGVLLLVGSSVDTLRSNPSYLVWAWLGAIFQGFSPVWYFQGVERLREPAMLDVSSKSVATLGIFLLVHAPEQGWIVLALRAGAEFASTGLLTLRMYRSVPPRALRLGAAIETLGTGWRTFVFSSAATLYTTANSFIMGLMALPREVSVFGAGERVVRATSSLLVPISQALYPRVSHLFANDRERAVVLLRKTAGPFVALGLVMGGVLFVTAPQVTRLAFGPGYDEVAGVVRVLALIPAMLGLGTILGVQWALPVGLDRPFSRLVVAAGVINIVLAVILVPRFGAVGMASAAVIAEAVVEVGLVWLALRHGSAVWAGRLERDPDVAEAESLFPISPRPDPRVESLP